MNSEVLKKKFICFKEERFNYGRLFNRFNRASQTVKHHTYSFRIFVDTDSFHLATEERRYVWYNGAK